MKVDELKKDSVELDLWVCRAISKIRGFSRSHYAIDEEGRLYFTSTCTSCKKPDTVYASPVTVDYNYVMSIAEKLKISIHWLEKEEEWITVKYLSDGNWISITCKCQLTAIKRCIIKSVFGEEVG